MSDYDADIITGAGLNESEEQAFADNQENLDFDAVRIEAEEDEPAEETAVVKRGNNTPAPLQNETPTDRLMMRALELGNVEVLERIIALKNSEEDRKIAEEQRQAKLKFDKDFAKMQKEFGPVKRTRENKQYNSKYAELSDLQNQYAPIISRHGFAYDWDEEYPEDGSIICTFLLSKHGYTKRTPVKIPPYTPDTGNTSGKSIMTPMQAVGTQLSYGHRYSMKAGLGVTETNEDTDGVILNFDDGMRYGEWKVRFAGCKTFDELKAEWKDAIQELQADQEGCKIVTHLKGLRYVEIQRELANGR